MKDPKGFLMIEPVQQATHPVIDEITRKVTAALRNATPGDDCYRGTHMCVCGAHSDNQDHYVMVAGTSRLSNSLAVHYVACHRSEISQEELAKIAQLADGEAEPSAKEIAAPKQ